jgi:hypothetical protein
MREIVFRVRNTRAGHFEAEAVLPADKQTIQITAPTLEELHHEAREALIERLGAAHCVYQVRLRHHSSPRVRALHQSSCAAGTTGSCCQSCQSKCHHSVAKLRKPRRSMAVRKRRAWAALSGLMPAAS